MANTSENKALPLGETGAELTWEEFQTIRKAAEQFYAFMLEGEFYTPPPEVFHQAGMLRCYYEYLSENASTWGDRELDPGLINSTVEDFADDIDEMCDQAGVPRRTGEPSTD
jgi:hypothetical protein